MRRAVAISVIDIRQLEMPREDGPSVTALTSCHNTKVEVDAHLLVLAQCHRDNPAAALAVVAEGDEV